MSKEVMDIGAAPITGNFEITLPAPNGASLRITGYVYAGEAEDSLNDRMDVCREALLRQQQVLEKPVLEEQLKMLKDQEVHVEKAYLDLLEKNNVRKLPASEAQHLQNYPLQLKDLKARIAKGEDKLKAIEAA
jgi:hypothetical protein